MATQLSNYQCPSCTAPLRFVPQSGRLECEYCGSSYTPAEIEALYAQKEQAAQAAFEGDKAQQEATAKAEAKRRHPKGAKSGASASQTTGKWDTSGFNSDWGREEEVMRAYNCPSCGAQLICEETTAATACPYCGNPTVVPGQFGGALRPDYVIPFKLDKEQAVAALKKHYRRKRFLPRHFKETNQLQKLQGIYVPFWLFDAQVDAQCKFDGQRVTSRRSGNYRITDTHHHDVYRAGTVLFQMVPTDASEKMPDDLMDSILPYRYDELVDFSAAYLPGYLADKYDVSSDACAQRADQQCKTSAAQAMKADVRGYSAVSDLGSKYKIHRGKVHYAFLPVWLLNTRWKGKTFTFAMNGQTGKLVGDLPVSRGKWWACFAILALLLSLVIYLVRMTLLFV